MLEILIRNDTRIAHKNTLNQKISIGRVVLIGYCFYILKSEYGEHMWWCCGKTSKEAPGCKYSKHISKEDEEDQEGLELLSHGDGINAKKHRCMVF